MEARTVLVNRSQGKVRHRFRERFPFLVVRAVFGIGERLANVSEARQMGLAAFLTISVEGRSHLLTTSQLESFERERDDSTVQHAESGSNDSLGNFGTAAITAEAAVHNDLVASALDSGLPEEKVAHVAEKFVERRESVFQTALNVSQAEQSFLVEKIGNLEGVTFPFDILHTIPLSLRCSA